MGKFDDDRAHVIDLLYRGYCYYKPHGSKKSVEVKIYYEELQSYGMDYDLFCEILFILEKEKVIKIIRQYKYDDGSFILDYGNATREETPNVADIECGQELENLYNSFVAGTNTNHKRISAQRRRNVASIDFPEKVQWEKVRIEIKEGCRDIDIFYDNAFIVNKDYIELGFYSGKKEKKPDRAWDFLIKLSGCHNDRNKITCAEVDHMCYALGEVSHPLKRDNVYQIKKALADKLKEIFDTGADPFDSLLANDGYYQPLFTLLPVPILRNQDPWDQGGELNENIDDINEEY